MCVDGDRWEKNREPVMDQVARRVVICGSKSKGRWDRVLPREVIFRERRASVVEEVAMEVVL